MSVTIQNIIGLWALMPFHTGEQRFPSREIKPNHEEFEFVLNGRASYISNGQVTEVHAGDVVWLREGDRTIHSNDEGTPYECFVIAFLVKDSALGHHGGVYRWSGSISPKQFIDDALHCLQRTRHESLTYCHFLYQACQLHLTPKNEQASANYKLDGILNFLQVNIREYLTIDTIANNFRMSTNQLTYLFQQELGVPPYQYLKRMRLQRAEQYLQESMKPVKWIAYMCGYHSESGFIRAFSKTHQISPLEFRALSQHSIKNSRQADGSTAQTLPLSPENLT